MVLHFRSLGHRCDLQMLLGWLDRCVVPSKEQFMKTKRVVCGWDSKDWICIEAMAYCKPTFLYRKLITHSLLHPITTPLLLPAPMTTPTPQIRCRGCNRVFSPHRLSQHLSKTHDTMCHEAQLTSRMPSLFQTVSAAGSSLASNSDNNEARVEALQPTDAADAADTAHADHTTDAVDAADTNLLAQLANGPSSPTVPDKGQPIEAQLPDHSTPPPIEPQPPSPALAPHAAPITNVSDTTLQVFVECFSLGSPSAPITGTHQGTSCYHSSHKAFGDSVWASFCSQCDWEIACWAKMCGPSSLAMEELLAIPGTAHRLAINGPLTHCCRLLISSDCHSAPPKS
jgi:hypothetical protein